MLRALKLVMKSSIVCCMYGHPQWTLMYAAHMDIFKLNVGLCLAWWFLHKIMCHYDFHIAVSNSQAPQMCSASEMCEMNGVMSFSFT